MPDERFAQSALPSAGRAVSSALLQANMKTNAADM